MRNKSSLFLRPFIPLDEPRSLNKGATLTMYQHTIFGMRCKSQEEHFPDSQSWGRARQLIRQTNVNLYKDRNRKPVKWLTHWSQIGKRVWKIYSHIRFSWSTTLSVYSRCLRQYYSSYGTWKPGMAPQGRGKQLVRAAENYASLGGWKKQKPSCNEMDMN